MKVQHSNKVIRWDPQQLSSIQYLRMSAFSALYFFECCKGNHSFVQCFLDNLVNSEETKTKSQVNLKQQKHIMFD